VTEVDYQLFVMLKRKVEDQNLHAKRIMACPCAYSDGTSRCSDLERAMGSMARKCRELAKFHKLQRGPALSKKV